MMRDVNVLFDLRVHGGMPLVLKLAKIVINHHENKPLYCELAKEQTHTHAFKIVGFILIDAFFKTISEESVACCDSYCNTSRVVRCSQNIVPRKD